MNLSPPSERQDYHRRDLNAPDDFYSSQDSIVNKNKSVKARMENLLDREMLGKAVYHGQNEYDLGWSDDE